MHSTTISQPAAYGEISLSTKDLPFPLLDGKGKGSP